VQDTLAKAGLMIDDAAIRGTLQKISIRKTEEVTISELEQALLLRKKGVEPWKTEEFKALRAEAEANAAKPPPEDFSAQGVAHRLYDDHRDRARRQDVREQQHIQEERENIEKTRRRRSPSPQAVRGDVVGHRLHNRHKDIEEKRKRIREEAVAEEMGQLDVVSALAARRGVLETSRHDTLFSEAEERRKRAEEAANAAKQAEMLRLQGEAVHRNARPMSPDGFDRLHDDYKGRQHRMKQLESEYRSLEDQKLEQEKQELKAKYPTVKGSAKLYDSKSARLQERPKASPTGYVFGSSQPRLGEQAQPSSEPFQLELVDHALAKLNAVVSLRCGMAPEDASEEVLQELAMPLHTALDSFRVAEVASKERGKGCDRLKKMPSMSLFNRGYLLDDHEGCRSIREPDHVNQMCNDVKELLTLADLAQEVLMAKVGAGEGKDVHHLRKRWPAGGKWQNPAVEECLFAYNPGIKTLEQACSKAWVRYGASSGTGQFKHLTDLARLGLVFKNSMALIAGLEDIKDKFEVVNIRNHYNMWNLLGERFVEVLVVLKGGELKEPFIAELRLEEVAYFQARQTPEPHLVDIKMGFRTMYERSGIDGNAVEYLARYALQTSKITHSLTIFRRHLARRFGSTVVAWRKAFGNRANPTFVKFAEVCRGLNNRDHIVEHWLELDPTLSGCISLFDLDSEAVISLAKANLRLRSLALGDEKEDADVIWRKMIKGQTLQRAGEMLIHEFRNALRPLGFSQAEAERIFSYLDGLGGCRHQPPASITVADLTWLLRLPSLVNLSPALLGKTGEGEDLERLRVVNVPARPVNGARALSPPAALLGRHSRLSIMSSEAAEAAFPPRIGHRSPSPAARPSLANREALRSVETLLPSNLQLCEGGAQIAAKSTSPKVAITPLPLPLPSNEPEYTSPERRIRRDSEVASPPVARDDTEPQRTLQHAASEQALKPAQAPRERSPGATQRSLGMQGRTASQRSLPVSLAGRSSQQNASSRREASPDVRKVASAPMKAGESGASTQPASNRGRQSTSSLQSQGASQKSAAVPAGSVAKKSTSSLQGPSASQKSLGSNPGVQPDKQASKESLGTAQLAPSVLDQTVSQKSVSPAIAQIEADVSKPSEKQEPQDEEDEPSVFEDDSEEDSSEEEHEEQEQRDVAGEDQAPPAESDWDSDGTTF